MSKRSKWDIDEIQFPRLLAEIRAVGLTPSQYKQLVASMDLPSKQSIDGLLERAEMEWERIKARDGR
jgi:hypothetical protein